jgi:uncharacterized protein (TIGR03085 family)
MPASIAQSERQALCSLFEDRGPLGPTLCEGWTTADLAAHLFVRERKPLAAPGALVRKLAPFTERAMDSAKRELGYEGLIASIRSGPPMPMRLVDGQMNTAEYFIHHEDVRRAAESWQPRRDGALDAALWPLVQRGAWLFTRRVKGTGLQLECPDFGSLRARQGQPAAILRGGPQELLLYLFGRKNAARVELEGPEAARAAVAGARFGI